ncbi:MAG TPA: substrate-binding domain-containing protein [Chloroflexota bacterium]|nr:substrate-binding domain-containing protein [Chloroflexota bacterium]
MGCVRWRGETIAQSFRCAQWGWSPSEVFRPRLTTVAQPIYELGRTAAELLLRRLDSHTPNGHGRVVQNGSLVVRESCGRGRHRPRPVRQLRAGRRSS